MISYSAAHLARNRSSTQRRIIDRKAPQVSEESPAVSILFELFAELDADCGGGGVEEAAVDLVAEFVQAQEVGGA